MNPSLEFFDSPNVIADTRFHRWGYTQRLMNAVEVVIHKPDRYSSRVILNLL